MTNLWCAAEGMSRNSIELTHYGAPVILTTSSAPQFPIRGFDGVLVVIILSARWIFSNDNYRYLGGMGNNLFGIILDTVNNHLIAKNSVKCPVWISA